MSELIEIILLEQYFLKTAKILVQNCLLQVLYQNLSSVFTILITLKVNDYLHCR